MLRNARFASNNSSHRLFVQSSFFSLRVPITCWTGSPCKGTIASLLFDHTVDQTTRTSTRSRAPFLMSVQRNEIGLRPARHKNVSFGTSCLQLLVRILSAARSTIAVGDRKVLVSSMVSYGLTPLDALVFLPVVSVVICSSYPVICILLCCFQSASGAMGTAPSWQRSPGTVQCAAGRIACSQSRWQFLSASSS